MASGGASALSEKTKRLRNRTVYKSGAGSSTRTNNAVGDVGSSTESEMEEHRQLEGALVDGSISIPIASFSFSIDISPGLNPGPVIVKPITTEAPPATANAPAAVALSPTTPICPTTLDMMEKIDEDATMFYALVPSSPGTNNGILCARLEVQAEGWVGFGISEVGKMVGSQAIIGLLDDGGGGSVLKYDLSEYNLNGVVPMDDDKQTLRNVSITQNLFTGATIMSFTKLLVEENEIPILVKGDNNFLHARGSSNEPGYHAARMHFIKDFSQDVIIGDPNEPYDPLLGLGMGSMPMSLPMDTTLTSTPSVSPLGKVNITSNPTSSPSISPTATKTSSPTTVSPTVMVTVKTTSSPTESPVASDPVITTMPPSISLDEAFDMSTSTSMSMSMSMEMSMSMKPTQSPVSSDSTITTSSPNASSGSIGSTGSPTKMPVAAPTPRGPAPPSSAMAMSTSFLVASIAALAGLHLM
eukprot:CAMPEP_0172311102 /NCGR_PEP_ID=MMETSP1058-20130122/13711_1 /TAXON_ID=83371 /ORGANISM="Detonula confervacea, Strain CCMP 353" /LENGTH=469 /DNA_ID=CAMNT_0013024175 /DNA_START=170 /DNA_END=1579 /DNA_ORIENTATION=-